MTEYTATLVVCDMGDCGAKVFRGDEGFRGWELLRVRDEQSFGRRYDIYTNLDVCPKCYNKHFRKGLSK